MSVWKLVKLAAQGLFASFLLCATVVVFIYAAVQFISLTNPR